jgi:hypothetical protein
MFSAWALVVSLSPAPASPAPVSPANPTQNGEFSPFAISAKEASRPESDLIYQVDDGTAEDSIGYGDGSKNAEALWFNQFDVISPCNLTTLTSVSIAWGSPAFPDESNGTPVTVAIWSDPDGDGNPSDAVLLGSVAGTIQNANTNTFVTYTFSPPVTLPSGAASFFVGDMTPANDGPQHFPQALDDNTSSHRQSWVALMSDYGPVNLTNPGANDTVGLIDDFGLPGNWLIRATASATPTPTPPPVPTPTPPLWYNGDFNGVNGLPNEQDTLLGAGQYAHTYDDFNVPDSAGWDVTAVYSNNLTDVTNNCVIGATWEIRQGITPGNGGTLIASGMTTTAQITPTGRSAFGYTEYAVQVNDISVHLPPANGYYLNVTPIGSLRGRSFVSTTSGANALGSPPGNNQNAYFDSNFFAASFVPTGDPSLGQPYDFSMGVRGTVPDLSPLVLQSAFSRKTHGQAGEFDLQLPLTGAEGIESRAGRNDSIYFTFNNNLTRVGSVVSNCGQASVTLDPDDTKNLIVTVGRDCNATNITISPGGIADDQGHVISASLTYGRLIGDVDGSGVVDVLDGHVIRAVAPSPVDSTNFRDDLNLDGRVNLKDHLMAKSHHGERLP